jgi:PAS domain S-box-containing protein
MEKLRRSGLDILGDVPWGTHLCQFYQSAQDLLEVLVGYFKQGLEDNEFCAWITCEPLGVEAARSALHRVVPDLDDRIRRGQIEFLDYRQWYLSDGQFEADRVLQSWVEKEREALAHGYEGLRATGNAAWLDKSHWKAFLDCEAVANPLIGSHRMLVLCTYSFDQCRGVEMFDVLRNHPLALVKNEGKWEVIRSPRQREAEDSLRESEERFATIFRASPVGIGISHFADGPFIAVNDGFCNLFGYSREDLLGRTSPELGLWPDSEERAKLFTMLRDQGRVQQFEARFRRKSGETGYVLVSADLIELHGETHLLELLTDITDRKQAEESLRQSVHRQRAILDSIPDPAWLKDKEGRFLAVNAAWCRFFGVDAEIVLGTTASAFVPPEVAVEFGEQDRGVMNSRHPLHVEELLTCKDGRPVWFETIKTPLFNDHGEVVGTTGLARDITERKVREREIERLNRLYAALSELNQIVVRVESREELFREVCRIIAEKAEFKVAWIGCPEPATPRIVPMASGGDEQSYLDVVEIYSDDRPEGRGPTGTCIREGNPFVVNDFAGDPRVMPWLAVIGTLSLRAVAALPIRFHGEVWGALTIYSSEPNVFQDKELALLEEAAAAISLALENLEHESQRKRAEDALRESEERFRVTFEEAPVGMVIGVGDGVIAKANRALCSISGYCQEELLGRHVRDLAYPEDRALSDPLVKRLLAGEIPSFTLEKRYLRKDGHFFWAQATTALAYGPDGKAAFALGVVEDITNRKRAEQEKLELERRLLHAQKLESIGILAGGIAHDFNNILAGIMGYADLVKRQLPASETAQEDLDVIKKAVQRAADLTRQMLAYSGKGKFIVEPVSLSRIVEDNKKMLAMSVSKKAVVRYDLASDLPTTLADASQIHQVILNLVINASDALGEQNGVIAITTDTIQCDRASLAALAVGNDLREGLYVRLEVSDTGCGMDQETAGKIFDPFFTTKCTGRGLGLAAVHGIVRGHKGAIRVLSEPGKGTTFQVLFPVSDTTAPLAIAKSIPAKPWHGTGTVLVVDDEEMVRTLASRMVEHAGFAVLTANDGEEAVRAYRQHQDEIVCVLLDLTMPKMSGEETFHALRQIRSDVRVILSSGYGKAATTERFSQLGPAGFIQKPYQFETLVARLWEALEGNRACHAPGTATTCSQNPPGIAPATSSVTKDAATVNRKPGGRTVLVVDDDKLVRLSTQVTFERAGFPVLTAPDGEEALRVYGEHQNEIACVYLDLTMPGMGGEQTLRELRRIDAHVRVILASGYSKEVVAERFARQGVWRIFDKLDSLDKLIADLRDAIADTDRPRS